MLVPWKESYDKPRQERHHFVDKGPYSQSYGFSASHVWKWQLDHKESWTPKNLCFWAVVLEKTLESPLDCKANQSILEEISPEYSLEGLMLKLKLQYFGTWCKELTHKKNTLLLGKIKGRRRRGWQRMRWLDDITYSVDMNLSKQGSLTCCSPQGCKELDMTAPE